MRGKPHYLTHPIKTTKFSPEFISQAASLGITPKQLLIQKKEEVDSVLGLLKPVPVKRKSKKRNRKKSTDALDQRKPIQQTYASSSACRMEKSTNEAEWAIEAKERGITVAQLLVENME
jgi:hypothetical protein